ncbi:helix-turn-helix domain-containing protein [Poseidonocella sp. HB161398]|uniref:helix-turn-helix domain-containing protein n=1 Tax=Poseidonocella sp. HB161398 TaxID=2320855 RepID=UPI0011090C43|nr:AraC family transcriptional regulator [Poseidonocella sp. HB161398]
MLHQQTLAVTRPAPAPAPGAGLAEARLRAAALGQLLHDLREAVEEDPATTHGYLDALESMLGLEAAGPQDDRFLPLMRDGTDGVRRGTLAPWQIRRVIAHAEAHLASAIAVEELAGIAGLSTGHFSRAFKASTGETPHGFLIRLRLRRAQERMLAGDEPLGEVAAACGFTDQAHMTRLFRRHVGDTPFLWRRRHAEG